ncbi:MAG: HAMP domain-containing sensor histidine kinase [Pseudomonadota bacterium]
MMYQFLANNRDDLIARCRKKVSMRPGRAATAGQLRNGIPIFLDQLIRTLELEQADEPEEGEKISGPAGGAVAFSEVRTNAELHGKDLLAMDFTVDQVVHDYGDLCQAVTDLAIARDAPFEIEEYRTLNRCLDNAIANAVSEFSYQRDFVVLKNHEALAIQRMGNFSQELRSILSTASLAFSAAKTGNLNLNGATGTILERSLSGLTKLLDNSQDDVGQQSQENISLSAFPLEDFIDEAVIGAETNAAIKGCSLVVLPVDAKLAIVGDRQALLDTVAKLLQNAIRFTLSGTEVTLSAYSAADRVLIDVKDNCGGLSPNVAATLFQANRGGAGEARFGLTLARQAIIKNAGDMSVTDIPGVGCVFTISLPRYEVLT